MIDKVNFLNSILIKLEQRISKNVEKVEYLENQVDMVLKPNNIYNPEETIAEVNEHARRASNIMVYKHWIHRVLSWQYTWS